MKKILLLFIILLASIEPYAQSKKPNMPIDPETGKITYSEVIIDSTMSSDQLYIKAREWFTRTFVSAEAVIDLEDKENGKLIGKSLVQVYSKAMGISTASGYMHYTFIIYIKDGRYKYIVTDMYHTGQPGTQIPDYGPAEGMIKTNKNVMGISYQKTFDQYLTIADNEVKDVISRFKNYMKQDVKKSEW